MKKTLLSLVALGATVCLGGIRATTPDMYGGNAKAWQVARHNEKMSIVTNGGAKVVFIGDSITHFWETKGAAQLEKYFSQGDMKMLDLGISADRTEHVLWRITDGKELDGYEAKCVLLMIGTNNAGHFRFSDEPPSDAILGIRKILKVIREKQPKAIVVLTAIFPRGETIEDSNRKRNNVVNAEIRKFCDGKTIFWCDFSDQFLLPDGRLPRELAPDVLHPNALGYEIWYAAVKPYVDYALSNGKLPLPTNRYPSHIIPGTMRVSECSAVYPVARIEGRKNDPDWWINRLERNREQIWNSKGSIDLVFAGDSITHNWEGPGRVQLEELRKKFSILNIGYSGDRTEHLIWRMKNGELDGYKAKGVMIMIGTNNANDSAEDVAKGVRAVLDTVAEKQPDAKVWLLPIFPRGASATDKHRVKNEQVNKLIRKYADGTKVVWVDFNDKFLDAKGDTKWIMGDRLHPSEKGYRDIWMPAMMPYFEAAVNGAN